MNKKIESQAGVLQVVGLSSGALLTNWSAQIPSGVSLVQGDEGSGKSTLLRLLAGALPAVAGQFQINGIDLASAPAAYRQQVFWTEPQSNAFDALTPEAYFQAIAAQYPHFDGQILAQLIDGLSLGPHMYKFLYMLSTGSKRKVWLAAAFASCATVTLLDEPFAALDMASIRFLMTRLQAVASHSERAWVLADYAAPDGLPLAAVMTLGSP